MNLIDKIKRYYKFTPTELKSVIITVIALGFIISFREWGVGAKPNLIFGLFNFFNAILIVTLSFLVHISAHKIAALIAGYRAEYKLVTFGLLTSLILAFVTNGRFWFLVPGGIVVHHLAGHRLGKFRYGLRYDVLGIIAFTGPYASLGLAALLKIINNFIHSGLIRKAILFNIIFAVYMILPIPPLDGSKTFFGSRMIYAFVFPSIIIIALLFLLNINVLIAIILALAIAVVCWLLYYLYFESGAWKGPFPK